MEDTHYRERLAKYTLFAAGAGIVLGLCWYFKSILIYVLTAVVVSLIAKPVVKLLSRISIKGHKAPDWLLATVSLTLVLGAIMAIVTLIIPTVSGIFKGISLSNIDAAARQIAEPLGNLNESIREKFPQVGEDFRIEIAAFNELHNVFDASKISNVIGSAASLLTSLGIGLFSVVFISFFFIKDDNLFTKIVSALVPDKHEENTVKAISDIGHLLSRYFIGVIIEMTGVALVNLIGLLLVARLGFNASISIAFLTGLLNIIPYIGPLAGGALGTVLALIFKYSSATPIGLDVNFWVFTAILITIFSITQLIDNFLYQPLIYSTSIKSTPLEIFIILLVIGHIGGPLAMIIAIPCYTVIRVIAFRFFRHIKAINRLIPDEKLITH